jgi:acylphosphatase
VDKLERIIHEGNYFIKVQSFGLEVRDVKPDEKRFDIRY